ncbi:immediate early protein [Streptomyces sp. NPDC057702]|uniref:immediate early protein n=1 Tax=unclassified Streptomyces TaxID=2593676 RepID=UPI003675972C
MSGPGVPGRSGPDDSNAPGPAGRPRIPAPRAPAEDSGHWPRSVSARPRGAPTTPPAPGGPSEAARAEAETRDTEPEADALNPTTARPDPRPAADTTPDPDTRGGDGAVSAASDLIGAPGAPAPSHRVLKSMLGAWALAACSPEEIAVVDHHLNQCPTCAEEAVRLRRAVGLLHAEENLDLSPQLRSRVLAGCLGRRPARIPVPEWAAPYDAETARLDALVSDMGAAEWRAPVTLRWFDGERARVRDTTVAGVIGHLLTVDGVVATAVGLPDPLGPDAPTGPLARTDAYWHAEPAHVARLTGADDHPPGPRPPRAATRPAAGAPLEPSRAGPRADAIRGPWRDQGHALIRSVSFAGRGIAQLSVPYGEFALPMRDSFLDRAFECWVHGVDIAEAVHYPYKPPAAAHLNLMIDLCARLLPRVLAERRQAGLASPPHNLGRAGVPSRTLHLEVEGHGGGHWYIALDSPTAPASPDAEVAHIALDREEFCQLVAGHVPPLGAAAGQLGDPEAIRDVLYATASLSRL